MDQRQELQRQEAGQPGQRDLGDQRAAPPASSGGDVIAHLKEEEERGARGERRDTQATGKGVRGS